MCRLFAISGDLSGARALLTQGEESMLSLTAANADGAGVGWISEAGGINLAKASTREGAGQLLGTAADDAREGSTLLAHIRLATRGKSGVDNNHPFLFADRLHAHNGTIGRTDKLEDAMGATYRAQVKGDTDTERWFAFVSKNIDANEGDIPQGLIDSAAWARTRLPVNSMNSIIARGDDIFALRYPTDEPLHVGVGVGPNGGATAAVGSQPNGNLAWDALDLGELVHLNKGRVISREQVISTPPDRILLSPDEPDGILRTQV